MDDARATSTLAGPLMRLRQRIRAILLGRGIAELAGLVLAIATGLIVLDFVVRWPSAMQWLVWLAGAAALFAGFRLLIAPALRFRPGLVDLALRVEQTESGSPVRGLLASALDLEAGSSGAGEIERELGRGVVERARAAIAGTRLDELVSTRSARQAAARFAAAGAVVALLAVARPELAQIGATRLAAPWAGAQWPKRTLVVAAPIGEVHPLGRELEVEALLTRTNRAVGETRVDVEYTVGDAEPTRLRLTSQERTRRVGEAEGEQFLTRLDLPPVSDEAEAVEVELAYRFVTEDDRTPWQRVLLVTPPSIESARLVIEPPAYAQGSIDPTGEMLVGERRLGAGDESGALGPVLAGSRATLELMLNKPAALDAEGPRAAWIAATSGASVLALDRGLTLSGVLDRSVRLEFTPVDRFGIAATMPADFAIDVVADDPPSVTITAPRSDEFVTPIATVPLEAEARDDLDLERLWLTRERARPPAGSAGAAPEPTGEIETVASTPLAGPVDRQGRIEHTLELSPLSLEPGEELWIIAYASDAVAGSLSARDPSASSVRRLRVISELELIEQARDELNATRRAARRLDEQQAGIERQTRDAAEPMAAAGEQRRLSDQLQRQTRLLEELGERLERNRVSDDALAQTIADGSEVLRSAATASAAAEQALQEASEQPDAAEPRERAGERQQEVRDRLGELSELLDRGEDGWLVRRDVERLLSEQRELLERTEAIGARTAGRDEAELSPDERSELERIADRQRRAAERSQGVLDTLGERGRQMEQADPAAAQAMGEAAQEGRRAGLEQQLQQAADQIQQNQTSSAASAQRQAVETLEEMLERLDEAEQQREQTLRRILASAIESIEGLITQQERELQALAVSRAGGDPAGLDAGMIALHGNTLGVLDLLRTGYRELASVADLVDDAATAQTRAIGVLRERPVRFDDAEDLERTSLARLRDAVAEAKRLEQQAQERDRARELAELRNAYREQLEQQVVLRSETEPLVEIDLDRRQQRALRVVGQKQTTIREALAEIRGRSEDLDRSPVISFSHDRLDDLAAAIAERAAAGSNDAGLLRRQDQMIAILGSLYEALDPEAGQSDFRDQQNSSGGGQQGQQGEEPLIPPLADLLLLREMQAQALAWTRQLDESGGNAEELRELEGLQRSLAERAQQLLDQQSEPSGGAMPFQPPTKPVGPAPAPAPGPTPGSGGTP